jgi:hypothetical protein
MNLAAHDELWVALRKASADVIIDGPIVPSRYEVAKPRIMWVLREAHGGKGWDYREFVDKNLHSYPHWRRTLGVVAKVSDGIIRGCAAYSELTRDPKKLQDRLREVAIVNANKDIGKKRIDWKQFIKQAETYAPTILRQIEHLDPHVLIFAGTFDVLKWTLAKKMSGFPESPGSGVNFDGRLYLLAAHPNQKREPHQKYYERIQHDMQRLLGTAGGMP